MKRRLLAMFLALTMLVGMLPTAFADEEPDVLEAETEMGEDVGGWGDIL